MNPKVSVSLIVSSDKHMKEVRKYLITSCSVLQRQFQLQ